MADTPRVFVVRRLPFREGASDCGQSQYSAPDHPLRAFADPEGAEAYRVRLEAEARRQVLPMDFVSWWRVSPEASVRLAEVLTRLGVEMPTDRNSWDWLHVAADRLTPEQRHALWEPFDALAFYEVVEVDLED